jgi:hypothetical protein
MIDIKGIVWETSRVQTNSSTNYSASAIKPHVEFVCTSPTQTRIVGAEISMEKNKMKNMTATEKTYGKYENLVAEGSYDLAAKVEAENAKNNLVAVECDCCERTRFLAPGQRWYCGCADE